MLTYRFYIFDKNGDTATTMTRVLLNDDDALTEAKKIVGDGVIEIWRGAGKGHKVTHLDPPPPAKALQALQHREATSDD